jgi:predicted DNA binding CopG/RHH family protein
MTQPQREPKPASRIPEFASREEEAAWWDSHDLADYQDEFKTVRARFAKNLSEGITVRLDSETLAELRQQAHEKGIGPTTLARMWIIEHLRASRPPRTA